MSEDIYDKIKPEKEVIKSYDKVKRGNKDNLIIIIVAVAIILAVAGIMCYYFIFRDKEIVATYDNGTVTRGEYELYYRTFAPMLAYYGYSSDVLSKYIAEKIILDKIIVSEATNNGFTLTDEKKTEVDLLFEDENNITEFANRSIDTEALKQVFYNDSIINEYIEKLKNETTDENVKEYIERTEGEEADLNIYNTRHILFQINSTMTDEDKAALKKKAEEVLVRVNKGEDFIALAKEFSDDRGTEENNEGKFTAKTSTTVKSYMDAVKALKVGGHTTKLVEDETYGYFIIKLDSISESGRVKDDTEIGYYVDDILFTKQKDANCNYKDEKISQIASTIGRELGLVSVDEVSSK